MQTGDFDLVITDKSMPQLSGDELAVIVKEMSPGARVIMLTGFGSMMHDAEERPDCIDLVLSKPIKLDEFRKAVRTVTARPGPSVS